MRYAVQIKPKAVNDAEKLPPRMRVRVTSGIEELSDGLKGDVKRLTNYAPEYRLRVGEYRVLFEIVGDAIVIYRILHRRDAYR